MRVIQLVPELESGGVEKGTLEVSKALVQAGHESLVISNGGALVTPLEQGGAVHLTQPVHRKSLRTLAQVGPLKRAFLELKPDIIHARSRVPAWLSYLAWKSLKPAQRPRFMTTFHGFHRVSSYSRIMARGERVIAVSEAMRQHILQHYPHTPPETIVVNHRGVDPSEYPFGYTAPTHTVASELRKEAGEALVITLPGRITKWKGGLDFLHLIAALRQRGLNVHGWFAGGTHPKRVRFAQQLTALAAQLGVSSYVAFLGQREDLKEILAVSDLVVSLSRKPEAFGRVTLEALSLGRPVVAYSHGGVAEQLQALYPEGAVEEGKLPEMVERIMSWKEGIPPVQRPQNHPFTLQQMTRRTLEVYQELDASDRG